MKIKLDLKVGLSFRGGVGAFDAYETYSTDIGSLTLDSVIDAYKELHGQIAYDVRLIEKSIGKPLHEVSEIELTLTVTTDDENTRYILNQECTIKEFGGNCLNNDDHDWSLYELVLGIDSTHILITGFTGGNVFNVFFAKNNEVHFEGEENEYCTETNQIYVESSNIEFRLHLPQIWSRSELEYEDEWGY